MAGLRRAFLTESQLKGEEGALKSPPDSPDRTASHQHGSRSRPLLSRHCLIGFVTIFAVAFLLVTRCGISLVVVDRVVSGAYEYSYRTVFGIAPTGSTSQIEVSSRQRSEHGLTVPHNGEGTRLACCHRRGRILAGQLDKSVTSSRNCIAVNGTESALEIASQAYHSPKTFYQDFADMACQFKIFVYPHSADDPFADIFESFTEPPTGNYASEHYFKMVLLDSSLVTENPAEADLFYLPFSIANMRNDPRIGVEGIKHFVKDYVSNISAKYPYWNRSGGADHFYVNCHSIGKSATAEALHVRTNAIQVVCSSNYHIQVFIPHKDASIPQVWPRPGFPEQAPLIDQRTTLAFFAGAGNSPVRALVAKHWSNDSEIKVYTTRIDTPYDMALLTSKYCLHVKGFEVNNARLADAMHFGCVPIIIADYHDLPFNDVLDWRQFSLVVTADDIPKLKDIIKAVSHEEYVDMQKNVMQVRQHFQWHPQPQHFDAFYMVMYELWLRRHVARFQSH